MAPSRAPGELEPAAEISHQADDESIAGESTPAGELVAAPAWSPSRRFGFRLLAVYFVLYTIPFPLGFVPGIGPPLEQGVRWLWTAGARWVDTHVLGGASPALRQAPGERGCPGGGRRPGGDHGVERHEPRLVPL